MSLLRPRDGEQDGRVTNIELFFDLVFVFAITQLSHRLIGHPTALGLAETTLLFFAVWWVWIFTGWVTNWLHPDRAPVRLMLLVLMLLGLMLSTAIPDAFGASGLVFAGAYVAMQLGRSLFALMVFRRADRANFQNFARLSIWFAFSGLFWLTGGWASGAERLALWAAALAIEYAGPLLGFPVPGFGKSSTTDWQISGGHLAERCGLFVIIALGEGIVVTGASFADLPHNSATIAAFLASFVGSAAMWWLYFDKGAEQGTQLIGHSADPGRLARSAYTYLHMPIVAGIIVGAVADEMMLSHPLSHASTPFLLAAVGGPALYLVGIMAFKYRIWGRALPPLSHLAGLGLLALLGILAGSLPPAAIGTLASLVLIVVAGWERLALAR